MPVIRSLRQMIAPKRLSQRMREAGRPFEPALLTPLLVIAPASVASLLTDLGAARRRPDIGVRPVQGPKEPYLAA